MKKDRYEDFKEEIIIKENTCSNCGEKVEKDWETCPNCGLDLALEDDSILFEDDEYTDDDFKEDFDINSIPDISDDMPSFDDLGL